MWLNLVECLGEVVNDVVDVLSTDRETHGGRRDVLFGQLLGRKLRVSGGVGMDHQTLHIGHIS